MFLHGRYLRGLSVHPFMNHYELTVCRIDGNFVCKFYVLADAMSAFDEVQDFKDDLRVCLRLHGPEVWIVSYVSGTKE